MGLLVLLAAVLAATLAAVPPWWFGRRRADYSHLRRTISELGETGAPDARKVAWLAFVPVGLSVGLFAFLLRGHMPAGAEITRGLGLLSLLGVSYLGAAVFPCDRGAPQWGSWHNQVHNLLGAVGYVGVGVGLIELGRAFEELAPLSALAEVSRGFGKAVLLGLLPLSLETPVRGLIQRLMEGLIFGWMLLVGGVLTLAGA